MSTGVFARCENLAAGTTLALEEVLAGVRFDDQGLVPAIAQAHNTLEVLMMAWMNSDALRETLETGRVCYWSRSRARLWRKGETSGQRQTLVSMRFDCDGDALLLLVEQQGPACHTGRRSCFYNVVEDSTVRIADDPLIDPRTLYPQER